MPGIVVAVMLRPGVALIEDWEPMTGAWMMGAETTGEEITAALTGHVMQYGDAVQSLEAIGWRVHTTTSDSVGDWRVEGDWYCSVLPPSDR